jgi:hypothetical protein
MDIRYVVTSLIKGWTVHRLVIFKRTDRGTVSEKQIRAMVAFVVSFREDLVVGIYSVGPDVDYLRFGELVIDGISAFENLGKPTPRI